MISPQGSRTRPLAKNRRHPGARDLGPRGDGCLFEAVIAPEQLIVDDHGRYAEDAKRQRLVVDGADGVFDCWCLHCLSQLLSVDSDSVGSSLHGAEVTELAALTEG